MCRHGGDEFVILLSEVEHSHDAISVARKLLPAFGDPHLVGGQTVDVTASIGVAVYPDHGQDASTLITNADAAMYAAKRSGLSTCRLFGAAPLHDGAR